MPSSFSGWLLGTTSLRRSFIHVIQGHHVKVSGKKFLDNAPHLFATNFGVVASIPLPEVSSSLLRSPSGSCCRITHGLGLLQFAGMVDDTKEDTRFSS